MVFTLPDVGIRHAPTRRGFINVTTLDILQNRRQFLDEHEREGLQSTTAAEESEEAMSEGEIEDTSLLARIGPKHPSNTERHAARPGLYERIHIADPTASKYGEQPSLIQSAPNFSSIRSTLPPTIDTGPPSLDNVAVADAVAFEAAFFQLLKGQAGTPEYDLPYDALTNAGNNWQWCPQDYTVCAQPPDSDRPWRPYCPGPPNDALCSDVMWAPMCMQDAEWFPYKHWHVESRSRVLPAVRLALDEAFKQIKAYIFVSLGKLYPHAAQPEALIPAWTIDYDVNHLALALPFHMHQLVWLRFQRKLRELKGFANYLQVFALGGAADGRKVVSKVQNYVGVQRMPDCDPHDLLMWAHTGVPVLSYTLKESGALGCLNHSKAILQAEQQHPSHSVVHASAKSKKQQQSAARPCSAKRKKLKRQQEAQAAAQPQSAPHVQRTDPVVFPPSRRPAQALPLRAPESSATPSASPSKSVDYGSQPDDPPTSTTTDTSSSIGTHTSIAQETPFPPVVRKLTYEQWIARKKATLHTLSSAQ